MESRDEERDGGCADFKVSGEMWGHKGIGGEEGCADFKVKGEIGRVLVIVDLREFART